ncbi:MAG: hypothetical protein ABTQ73_12080 [Caldilineales bacterium]
MELRKLFNSAPALRLGLWLGRVMPRRAGLRLADLVARAVARQRTSPLMLTLQGNLRVVLGADAPDERVYQTARSIVRHAAKAYFDLYHALAVGPEALLAAVDSTPLTDYTVQQMVQEPRGAMVVMAHMSNYDLGALAFLRRGLMMNVLSYATPTSGYALQNKIRLDGGMNLMPVGVNTLRDALKALRNGEIVATGVDRPDPFGGGEELLFFGKPARLPVGHIRLALQTNAPVIIGCCEYRPIEDQYRVHMFRRLEMEHVGTRQQDVVHNAQRVLAVLEDLIAAHPEQWLMFYPLWDQPAPEGEGVEN